MGFPPLFGSNTLVYRVSVPFRYLIKFMGCPPLFDSNFQMHVLEDEAKVADEDEKLRLEDEKRKWIEEEKRRAGTNP